MLFLILAWRTRVPRVSDILLSSTQNTGFGSSARYEPCQTTDISSRFFRQRGEGCHFRFRAPANHWLLPFSPPGQAILLGLIDVTQVRLLLIQTAVIPLPSSQWDITWHYDITSFYFILLKIRLGYLLLKSEKNTHYDSYFFIILY